MVDRRRKENVKMATLVTKDAKRIRMDMELLEIGNAKKKAVSSTDDFNQIPLYFLNIFKAVFFKARFSFSTNM